MKKKKKSRNQYAILASALLFASAGCICAKKPVSVFAQEAVSPQQQIFLPEWSVCISAKEHVAKLRVSYAGNKMTGQKKKIYDFLTAQIQKVAAGEKTSTKFAIAVEELVTQLQYTQEELGVSLQTKEGQQKAVGQFMERKIITQEELHEVYTSLLADLPYELYWYDKAAEGSFTVSLNGVQIRDESGLGKCLCMENAYLTFDFLVDGYYGNPYETNAAAITAAKKAEANAKKIVEQAAALSDYQKLVYYRNKICELSSYNDEAARTRSPGNQNAWQMIYVFDEDDTTSTVCEGYAKAFQYLCDMTSFDDEDIYSYIVIGRMQGNTGEGPHMWNIVHMGDYGNYLVDVTNCDEGMIGAKDQLFLAGASDGNVAGGYRFRVSSGQVTYKYEEDMRSIYSSEDLTLVQGSPLKESDIHLHTWNETQKADASCTAAGKRVAVCPICQKVKVEEIPAIGHDYEWSSFWSDDKNVCTIALACKNDRSHRLAQHAQDAQMKQQHLTFDVKDTNGSLKYTLVLDTKDMFVGNVLFAYRTDSKTSRYQMVDGQTPNTVQEDGSIVVSLPDHGTYQLLNQEEAAAANQKILRTVAPRKSSVAVKKGKSVLFSFNRAMDMENVANIDYSSSKKAVVQVSANGKMTGKKAGKATVKAKVTLKNGMKKVVSVKVKVS